MTPAPTVPKPPFYEGFLQRHLPGVAKQRAKDRLEAAVYRHAERNGPQASYRGGVATRTSEGWDYERGYKFGTSADRLQLGTARDRAYQAYKNNSIAKTLVDTETLNVIGDGLNYQPTTDSPEWNREAEDRYYEWIDKADIRKLHSGAKLQRLAWGLSRVAGDIGWVLVSQGSESRIQLVRSENIVTPDGKFGQPNLIDGIQFDANGAAQSFHVLTVDDRGERKFTEVMERDFVFLPHYTNTNQARGETCYMTIFEDLNDFARYREGVALAAWMATVFGIIFKQQSPGADITQLGYEKDSQGVDRRAITLENGMFKYMGTDEDVAQVQAHQPMQQTPEYFRAMLRNIGMPFEMPLEVIAKDMSSCTFASARIGLLPFYRSCRMRATTEFGPRWSRTIQWWLSRERLRAPDDPKRWKTKFPDRYWSHELLPNAWDYTDPVNEAQSDLLQMDMGTKSPQMVIAERGRDAAKIIREREEWIEKTKDLPETRSTLTRDPAPEPVAPVAPAPTKAPPPANALQQDMVRAWMGDKTTREIIYNVADVPATLADAGVKLDAKIDSADGECLPRLPDVEDEESTNGQH